MENEKHKVDRSKPPTNYAEYLMMPEDERWEIIEGVPYLMSPAPLTEHQRTVNRLSGELYIHFKGKECEVFTSPFDVKPFANNEAVDANVETIVQPDVMVICDKDKFDRRGYNGAPDLVIEVLSDSTAKRDKDDKLRIYRRAKVKEYWIVDPHHKFIEVYVFRDDEKVVNFNDKRIYSFEENETIKAEIFEDLEIKLEDIFG